MILNVHIRIELYQTILRAAIDRTFDKGMVADGHLGLSSQGQRLNELEIFLLISKIVPDTRSLITIEYPTSRPTICFSISSVNLRQDSLAGTKHVAIVIWFVRFFRNSLMIHPHVVRAYFGIASDGNDAMAIGTVLQYVRHVHLYPMFCSFCCI